VHYHIKHNILFKEKKQISTSIPVSLLFFKSPINFTAVLPVLQNAEFWHWQEIPVYHGQELDFFFSSKNHRISVF